MKNNTALIFRSMLLLIVAVSFAVANRSSAVLADGLEITQP